ncbi:MAG: VWA domain-containing protein [Ignisphaera sp.]|uniref:DUF2201 family putative metallopeptidase n=1 Tax=Thermofilum sp. TaxID=1961369 RepID=UPI003169BDDD
MNGLDIEKMRDEIKTIIAVVTARDPFLGSLLRRTWIYLAEDDKQVAWTDGIAIYVTPRLLEFKPAERVFVLMHEAMHIVLKHPSRAVGIVKEKGVEPFVVNVVADLKVHQYLEPPLSMRGRVVYADDDDVTLFGVVVSDWKSKSIEEIVDELTRNVNGGNIAGHQSYQVGKENEDLDYDGSMSKGKRDEGKALNTGDKEDLGESSVEERIARKLIEAYSFAKAIGRLPGYAEEVIKPLLGGKTDWRKWLRYYLNGFKKCRRTWGRANRKMPIYPGRIEYGLGDVVVMLDTSGSMSSHELAEILGEILSLASCSRIFVYQWDTRVTKVDVLKSRADIDCFTKGFKVRGRGGTLIKDALRRVIDKHRREIIIIASDWMIGDLNDSEVEEMLRRNSSRIIALTTNRVPPKYLKSIRVGE